MAVTWVNGVPCDRIAVNDRGLAYGDGLFETIAVVAGRPRLWEAHLDRLRAGCARLQLPEPPAEPLWREARALCRQQPTGHGLLKLLYTRGSGGRGYAPPAEPEGTRILTLHPWPDWPETHWRNGIELFLCQTRLARQPLLAGLKHLNRLEQVLARSEWSDERWAEGLVRDGEGWLIEGTASNLFGVAGETLITPPLDDCGVAGVMRRNIMLLSDELQIPYEVTPVDPNALRGMDEVFVSNSLAGIWPVRGLSDGTVWAAPGPVTRRLQQALCAQGVVPGPGRGEA
ncbi:aminodeoxychorismate lyase [Alkalilimnicola ehrlichii MLHE-1]|uniref:Aminodeoxychorismate lyase n=1 Tax=Alkalilimnicola ehrlichii (strain ATCC BAA-1101 / DSM 17681 / MLHE-1) TaxID=187272 RepID=Q0A8S0_ALKEH|nr:aminodeoxychorismate lyase [Alkalilimnicola ehrlichii]ABI56767.1 aminodeoxychorismate lyase apoprotein [Alkalilimnicola ehrlichii MLHE-1]